MKIAIDLTQIPGDKTGIGIYAVNLVKEMLRINSGTTDYQFYFFLQDDDNELHLLLEDAPNATPVPIKAKTFRKLPLRFLFEQFILPRRCKRLGIDIIYSFHYTMPYFCRIKRIVNIPDMTFYLFPELHLKTKRLYFRTLIPYSLKRSHTIVTISDSTKKDILKRFPEIDEKKIAVIHLGVNLVDAAAEKEEKREEDTICLEKFGLKENKFALFVGTLEPRKNITNIIRAFHSVCHSDDNCRKNIKLVIVGKKGWFYEKIFQTVIKLKLEKSIIFTGYIAEEEKQTLLRNAFLFVYPSFYEGFGIPVIEAMNYGLPVITSNVSSLPEVAGDAAITISPGHWPEIATSMLKLLSDQKVYDKMSQKSLLQAKKFSWQKTAEKTLELFSHIPEKDA
ncbi:MAG: glycosyltransferase family 4 protein [bacterium]|nr:glycosyltransferase family 4 protein [bacterium]